MSDDLMKSEQVAALVLDLLSGGTLSKLGKVAAAIGIETAAARADKAVAVDQAGWMFDRVSDLEESVRQHGEQLEGFRWSDVGPVVEALAAAHRTTADPNKRKLLEAAARNAFDPEIYQSGMTVVLLEKLERLSYGDVVLLRGLDSERSVNDTDLEAHHAQMLADERLVYLRRYGGSARFSIGRTELGKMLLRLLIEDVPAREPNG